MKLEGTAGCCYPTGRGLRLPKHSQMACAEREKLLLAPELDCCCHYPTGRELHLPSFHQVLCGSVRDAGAKRLLLLSY